MVAEGQQVVVSYGFEPAHPCPCARKMVSPGVFSRFRAGKVHAGGGVKVVASGPRMTRGAMAVVADARPGVVNEVDMLPSRRREGTHQVALKRNEGTQDASRKTLCPPPFFLIAAEPPCAALRRRNLTDLVP